MREQMFVALLLLAGLPAATGARAAAVNRWNMTIYRFRGDQIVAAQTRSGWGNDAPTSAYR